MTVDPLPPVNTTGAGDCFFAVYLSFRTQGAAVEDAIESAAAGAALTLSDPLSVSPLLEPAVACAAARTAVLPLV